MSWTFQPSLFLLICFTEYFAPVFEFYGVCCCLTSEWSPWGGEECHQRSHASHGDRHPSRGHTAGYIHTHTHINKSPSYLELQIPWWWNVVTQVRYNLEVLECFTLLYSSTRHEHYTNIGEETQMFLRRLIISQPLRFKYILGFSDFKCRSFTRVFLHGCIGILLKSKGSEYFFCLWDYISIIAWM